MALEMVFRSAVGEPAEGSPVEGVHWAGQQLCQPIEFSCQLPALPCPVCPGSGKSRRSGKQAVNNTGRMKGNLLLCFLSWLDMQPTSYHIFLPKVGPARAHSFHRSMQLSHGRARRNQQCLFISCLSPQDSCSP